MSRLIAEVHYAVVVDPTPYIEEAERILESRAVGLGPLAETVGSTEDIARAEGSRVLGLNEKTPRPRPKITSKWRLAQSVGDSSSGIAGATWSDNSFDFEPEERPIWMAAINWVAGDEGWVKVQLDLRARRDDVLLVAQRVGSDLTELMVELLALKGAEYAYATVTDVWDEPRREINGFWPEPVPTRSVVFGYSWMTWVPSDLARLLDSEAAAAAHVTGHDIADGSGGLLVVSSSPTVMLSTPDLTALRTYLEPVLLPERLDAPARRHERRPCPAGLLPQDWI